MQTQYEVGFPQRAPQAAPSGQLLKEPGARAQGRAGLFSVFSRLLTQWGPARSQLSRGGRRPRAKQLSPWAPAAPLPPPSPWAPAGTRARRCGAGGGGGTALALPARPRGPPPRAPRAAGSPEGRPAAALPDRKSWLGWALRREPRRRVPGEVELFFTSEEINFHIRDEAE